jgi:hypothetical protein
MDIEQLSPNKPNFPLIVALFCVTILILLGVGYWFLHRDAGKLLPKGNPHATIVQPAQPLRS